MKDKSFSRFFYFPLLSLLGFFVLAAGLVIPVLGIETNTALRPLLTLVIVYVFFILLVLGYEFIQIRRNFAKLSLDFYVAPNLYAGTNNDLEIVIRGDSLSRSLKLELRPEVPLGVFPEQEIFEITLPRGTSHAVLEYKFRPLKRGKVVWEYCVGRVKPKRACFRWHFIGILDLPIEAIVYPNHMAGGRTSLKPFLRHSAGETPLDLVGGEGREFDSLRQYTSGDDLRKVDWKRSAHGTGLFTKVYRPESHQRINIALDCSRRMGNRIEKRRQIDIAVDATASLMRLTKESEDEVGLFAFHHQVISNFPCKRGSRQVKLLLNELIKLEVAEFESDYQLLAEWARYNRRRSLLILVTSLSSPAGLQSIQKAMVPIAKKHLPLVFAVADRDLTKLVNSPAESIDDAYMVAAGMEQLTQIDTRTKQLKRMGVECIYCDAYQLPELMRQKYYQLKLSGRL